MVKNEIVELVEFFDAQEKWVTFWYDQKLPVPKFSEFLGDAGSRDMSQANWLRLRIKESVAHKVKMLNGPHSYTILKAYQIRKSK